MAGPRDITPILVSFLLQLKDSLPPSRQDAASWPMVMSVQLTNWEDSMDETILGILTALLLPFFGTSLGASFSLTMKKQMSPAVQKALLGFAAGVMIAASVWSLIIPAIDSAESQGMVGWVPAAAGFLLGVGMLLAFDHLLPHMHLDEEVEGPPAQLKKSTMLIFAVTLHNLPEGMAVGAVLAGWLAGDAGMSLAGVMALAAGIAIQNVPEGAIVAAPLASAGLSKGRAFAYGVGSGAVEPLGALIMLAIAGLLQPLLPFILAFAAGAMIYVVVEELIPETQMGAHTNIGTIGVALGFTLMMILDVALG